MTFLKCTFLVAFPNLEYYRNFLLDIHLPLLAVSSFEMGYALHMGVDCDPLHFDMG